MGKKTLLVAIAVISLAALASADNFVQFGSRTSQNPDDIFDWSQLGPDGTMLSTPQFVASFGGNLALVGDTTGGNFFRMDEGASWHGNFDYGETLLWTGNPNFSGGGPGPLAMLFSNGVASVGMEVQTDLYGPFTGTLTLLDSGFNPLFSINFSGTSDGLENGSALFLGLGDNSGANIYGFVLSTDSGDPSFANDFAIDDVSTAQVATPEPASLALMGSGLVELAGAIRRKLHA